MLRCGFSYAEILELNWYQIEAYITAYDADENERLVILMNLMAVAYGGTAKNRKEMAEALLGISNEFDPDKFESMMANIFANTDNKEEKDSTKAWALKEFNADDPAFKIQGK
jgi:hypothetical protein